MSLRDDKSNLGYFSYPTNDTTLTYNFRDTVAASWTSFDGNSTAGAYLSLWYWLKSGKQKWQISLNTSVGLNGSQLVELDIASEAYLGQFNLNLFLDNTAHKVYYLSEFFSVDYKPSQEPLIWPATLAISPSSTILGNSATVFSSLSSSSSSSSSSFQGIFTSVITSSSSSSFEHVITSTMTSLPQSTPTPPGTAQKSGPKLATIAGVSVGAALGVLLALVIALLMRRRRIRKSQASSRSSKPAELANSAVTTNRVATELPGKEAIIEMPVHRMKPRELPAGTFIR